MKTLLRIADKLAEATVVFSYSATGYAIRKRLWKPDGLKVDLNGKTILVTGANSGLGLAASKAFARMGARVLMVCRNTDKGKKALHEVRLKAAGKYPVLELADLSSLSSVKELAQRIGNRFEKLDVIVNNAGVLLDDRLESIDGIEMTFATNVLGGFLLTHKLLPLLKKAAPSRLVHVTSGGMYTQKLDIADLLYENKPYDGVEAYAQTKRAQVMLNEMWAETLKPDCITSNCMHPGWADTPGVERSLPRFFKLLRPILRSPFQGADTIVWLGASDQPANQTGKLFFDRTPRRTHVLKRTKSPEEDYRKLWEFCMEKAQLY